MHSQNIITAGNDISEAKKVLVMLHGRGGNAREFLTLGNQLDVSDFALFAPQATYSSWYPHSFLAKPAQNEPWLSSALEILSDLLEGIKNKGIASENIYFAGFSQGACLAAEFVTRNATRFGGIVLFTGGLIGDKIYTEYYKGDFAGTPIFIGTGNPDSHVPVERVNETAKIMEKMNAEITVKVYDNSPHSISQNEFENANILIFK
jgi:phospholipase/carboxylesterase